MRLNILLFVFLLLPTVATAELTFEQLKAVSQTPEELEGQFAQEKYLAALDAELSSSGVFKYQRGVSIHWQTLKPIQNELLMTPASISNKQAGQELMRLEGASNPIFILFNEIFFSILTAEWQALSSHFLLTGEMQNGQWHASLVPVDVTVKQLVDQVELEGDKLVRKIIIYEGSGDRTTISLDSLKP